MNTVTFLLEIEMITGTQNGPKKVFKMQCFLIICDKFIVPRLASLFTFYLADTPSKPTMTSRKDDYFSPSAIGKLSIMTRQVFTETSQY